MGDYVDMSMMRVRWSLQVVSLHFCCTLSLIECRHSCPWNRLSRWLTRWISSWAKLKGSFAGFEGRQNTTSLADFAHDPLQWPWMMWEALYISNFTRARVDHAQPIKKRMLYTKCCPEIILDNKIRGPQYEEPNKVLCWQHCCRRTRTTDGNSLCLPDAWRITCHLFLRFADNIEPCPSWGTTWWLNPVWQVCRHGRDINCTFNRSTKRIYQPVIVYSGTFTLSFLGSLLPETITTCPTRFLRPSVTTHDVS